MVTNRLFRSLGLTNTQALAALFLINLSWFIVYAWINAGAPEVFKSYQEAKSTRRVNSLVLSLPSVRTFIDNSVHYQLEGDDDEWEALYPNNEGTMMIPVEGDNKTFTIGMFHQLRCLDVLRRELVLRLDNEDSDSTPDLIHHHCVDYLRQMILCRADLELDPVFGKPYPAVIPGVYECKDWTGVHEGWNKEGLARASRYLPNKEESK